MRHITFRLSKNLQTPKLPKREVGASTAPLSCTRNFKPLSQNCSFWHGCDSIQWASSLSCFARPSLTCTSKAMHPQFHKTNLFSAHGKHTLGLKLAVAACGLVCGASHVPAWKQVPVSCGRGGSDSGAPGLPGLSLYRSCRTRGFWIWIWDPGLDFGVRTFGEVCDTSAYEWDFGSWILVARCNLATRPSKTTPNPFRLLLRSMGHAFWKALLVA